MLTATLVAVVALLAACGSDDDAADTTTTDAPATSESTTSTIAADESTSSAPPAGDALEGAATTDVSVPQAMIETAQLVDVEVGAHDGYDRVVFTFDGELPGYDIGYVALPVTQDGSGNPIELAGTHAISVRLTPASGVLLLEDGIEETYTGPDRIAGNGTPVTEVVRAGDFEAQATWAIGVDGEQPFKVSTLSSPTRVVVDVAAG